MDTIEKEELTPEIISHGKKITLDLDFHEHRLENKSDLVLPLEVEKSILRELVDFEFGRFMLQNKGLNAYWTSYAILHGLKKPNLHPLENWILNDAPVFKATRERFNIFKDLLQKQLRSHTTLASVPCGAMDCLLSLDYSDVIEVNLVGIDLDREALALAKQNSNDCKVKSITFLNENAWNLSAHQEYDLITSNGLNIYEPSDESCIALYKQFNKALKIHGTLITSYLTPPPVYCTDSPWKNYSLQDVLKQKALLGDILEMNSLAFITAATMNRQLSSAGFEVIETIEDSQGMFPSVIARKIAAA